MNRSAELGSHIIIHITYYKSVCDWHITLVLCKIAHPDGKLCMQDGMSVLLSDCFEDEKVSTYHPERGNRAVLQDVGWMKVAIHYCD